MNFFLSRIIANDIIVRLPHLLRGSPPVSRLRKSQDMGQSGKVVHQPEKPVFMVELVICPHFCPSV